MALIVLTDAKLAFGHVDLLANTAFSLESGERVGLIGRNGTGKSSLLKILAGIEKMDDGLLQYQQGLRIAYVPQEPIFEAEETIFESVSKGVAQAKALREEYEALSVGEWDDASHDRLDEVQSQLEALSGWNWEQRVHETLDRLHLEADLKINTLSGGTKKRVALARALVEMPDVLLLDEPTNHLDLDSIAWLEELLKEYQGSVILITHDRAFLDNVCTQIVELDRGILRSYPGNFTQYEVLKEQELNSESLANARADKLLAQEEVWIRKGVEARRTRSVARIARLEKLRSSRAERRDAMGQVKLAVSAGDRSGKIVADLQNVSKTYDRPIVKDFTATILRGDKVGLLGPNGAGKTTLLKLILGTIAPDSGTATMGTRIEVAYFDQMREGLDLNASLEDYISPGSEWIEINGNKKHVKSYLSDFLFAPERTNSPVSTLSGGERNRLLLARLFARPANVLVLDEPTNDLDIDTLDLLEQLLQDYKGTVFLVSHDRYFLDNVVTSIIANEGDGFWREYEGGYEDWKIQKARSDKIRAANGNANTKSVDKLEVKAEAKVEVKAEVKPVAKSGVQKLNGKERQELEVLPLQIETLETEQADIGIAMSNPDLYKNEPELAASMQARLSEITADLDQKLQRWEQLLSRSES
ncbi:MULTISPECIES: ATP-binding cassette domain-containing protein [unclassified Polynucleobacter]|jgi:ATP-binding cassette subfamily F protein uup|uniref:ATP-binding cassette domain-containing protein n=1 Tax=unclassified Polynucleobacter TaxID=2640945 RepID=UPI00092B6964|nr:MULTISPECIES: ATP-binding cassette domain-containing protein [unclassified Polynucleobacter]MBU3563350.1 ATP-binding cassette domain-containing protein [Polynucleobacter sp. Tro8-14-1]MBU3642071.1 ATP-binding cassette domain-containing protein [Polynucleobacter sp. Fuers-14]MEA9568882.1 ATP-binding cassette domain-containing protein [Polynucleobacter sp. AP-Nickl1-40-C4]OJI04245.1 ABC transporter ATP-binding protein [Polynucleobacter sp. MWH-Adler-W8]